MLKECKLIQWSRVGVEMYGESLQKADDVLSKGTSGGDENNSFLFDRAVLMWVIAVDTDLSLRSDLTFFRSRGYGKRAHSLTANREQTGRTIFTRF